MEGSACRLRVCAMRWRTALSPVMSAPSGRREGRGGAPLPARIRTPALPRPELMEVALNTPAVAAAVATVRAGRPAISADPAAPAEVVAV